MQKLPMRSIVLGDEAGTSEKYRKCRVIVQVGDQLIPVCWTFLATDGSVYFGLTMGDTPLTEMGEASINPSGKISFDTKIPLTDVPVEERQKTHVSLHPSGVCQIRFDRAMPVTKHVLDKWFPVQAGFVWIQAYTSPIGSLPRVQAARRRDQIMPFPNLELSARIEVAIHPRTLDASLPIVNSAIHTFAGVSPHHIVRISVDSHAATVPTLVIRQKLSDIYKQAENG